MNDMAPPPRILQTALIAGAIGFTAGYVGPLIFSDSNLGPLLGIFITGPLGAVLGMLIGIIRSARQNDDGSLVRQLLWLAFAWALSLFFLFVYTIGGLAWVALVLQIAVIGTGGFLLAKKPRQLPGWVRQSGFLFLAAAVLTVFTSMFPPLASSPTSGARFAFFLDERFDASRNIPEFSVDQTMLLQEWLIIAAITAAAVFLIRAARTLRDR